MPKLLKRKKPFPWEKEFCNKCHCLLIIKHSVAYGDNHWCPKCKSYRYPKFYKGMGVQKIEPEIVRLDTIRMKNKIDAYEKRFFDENRAKIKIYTQETHSKEFLMSLIPKKD